VPLAPEEVAVAWQPRIGTKQPQAVRGGQSSESGTAQRHGANVGQESCVAEWSESTRGYSVTSNELVRLLRTCVSAANRALSREAAASGGPSLLGGAASVDAIDAAVNAALPSS